MKSPQIVVFYDRKGKIGKMETDKFMSTYAHRTEFLDDAVERFNREKQISGEDTFAKVEFAENKKDRKETDSIIEIREEVQIGEIILEVGDKIEIIKESITGFEAKIEKEHNGLRIIKLVNPNLNPKRGRFQLYLLMDEENTLIDYSTISANIYRTFYRSSKGKIK